MTPQVLDPITVSDMTLIMEEERERLEQYETNWLYYNQGGPPQLEQLSTVEVDDNVLDNMTYYVVERGIDFLFGADPDGPSVHFEVDGRKDGELVEWLDEALEAMRFDKFLRSYALNGAVCGHAFAKVLPPSGVAIGARLPPGTYPRVIALDPAEVSVVYDDEDIDHVTRYTIQYNVSDVGGRPGVRRQEFYERNGKWYWFEAETQTVFAGDKPLLMRSTMSSWRIVRPPAPWPYDWPPIVENQNLVAANQFYGCPDITESVRHLQDAVNRNESNMGRILMFFAFPLTIAEGITPKEGTEVGPGKLMRVSRGSKVYNVEMSSDMAASLNYTNLVRDSYWAIARMPDPRAVANLSGDRVTNYRITVLYSDLTAKTGAKRMLYGAALKDMIRRVLDIGGFGYDHKIRVLWPTSLPSNEVEMREIATMDKALGVASTATLSRKLGYDPEAELEKLDEEESEEAEEAAELQAAQPQQQPPQQAPGMSPTR